MQVLTTGNANKWTTQAWGAPGLLGSNTSHCAPVIGGRKLRTVHQTRWGAAGDNSFIACIATVAGGGVDMFNEIDTHVESVADHATKMSMIITAAWGYGVMVATYDYAQFEELRADPWAQRFHRYPVIFGGVPIENAQIGNHYVVGTFDAGRPLQVFDPHPGNIGIERPATVCVVTVRL